MQWHSPPKQKGSQDAAVLYQYHGAEAVMVQSSLTGCSPSTDLTTCAGAKRKESRNRALLKDRFLPRNSLNHIHALPTACFAGCIISLYLNSWSASPGVQIPLTVLLLPAHANLHVKDTHNLINHESNGLNFCSSKNEQILTWKVGATSCAIWNNSWFHHCNSSGLRNNSQVSRGFSKEAPRPALPAAPMAHTFHVKSPWWLLLPPLTDASDSVMNFCIQMNNFCPCTASRKWRFHNLKNREILAFVQSQKKEAWKQSRLQWWQVQQFHNSAPLLRPLWCLEGTGLPGGLSEAQRVRSTPDWSSIAFALCRLVLPSYTCPKFRLWIIVSIADWKPGIQPYLYK